RKASPGFYRLYIRKEAVKTRPKNAPFRRRSVVILSSCATFSSESRRRTLVPCWTAGINGFKGAPKEPQRSPKGRVGSAKGPENAQGLVRQALPGHRGRIRRISFGAAEAFVRSAA